MTSTSKHALLEAAAKTLAWELYKAASYGRTRAYVDVARFNRELLSIAATWKATCNNLQLKRREKHGNIRN